MLRRLLAPVVLALAFPVVLSAQSQATTGIIRGVVTDPAGAAVAGATVTLHELQTGFQRQLTTNERGVFVASLMPLGVYDVGARAVGFSEVQRKGVRLGVGETVNLNLPLAAVQLQAVVVEATQAVVEASKTENSTRVPSNAISGLPNNGRNYLNLTLLTPQVAVVQGPDGDELTIAGQKGIHNNISTVRTSTIRSLANSAAVSGRRSRSISTRCRRSWSCRAARARSSAAPRAAS